MFRKTLAATTLALSLALSPVTATPAAAGPDGEDLAKAAIGLLIIGAIASAARDNRRESRAARDHYQPHDPRPGRGHGHGGRHDWNRPASLPASCAFEIRTDHGRSDVYGRRCVENAGFRTLPAACAFDVRIRGERRTVYGARCLSEFGYRTLAHRR